MKPQTELEFLSSECLNCSSFTDMSSRIDAVESKVQILLSIGPKNFKKKTQKQTLTPSFFVLSDQNFGRKRSVRASGRQLPAELHR